jgi:hypothetical protein
MNLTESIVQHGQCVVTFAMELRLAATQERDDWGGWTSPYPKASAVHLALADWLDHTASLVEGNSGAIEGVHSSGMALLTARAINDSAGVVTA